MYNAAGGEDMDKETKQILETIIKKLDGMDNKLQDMLNRLNGIESRLDEIYNESRQ